MVCYCIITILRTIIIIIISIQGVQRPRCGQRPMRAARLPLRAPPLKIRDSQVTILNSKRYDSLDTYS